MRAKRRLERRPLSGGCGDGAVDTAIDRRGRATFAWDAGDELRAARWLP